MILLRCISYIVSFNDMFRLYLWAIFRLITFRSKVKYTISNAIVLLPTRSLITYKSFNIDPTYSNIKIELVEVNL